MAIPKIINTVEIEQGLTLSISDSHLASELGKLNRNNDRVINLNDFPKLSADETEESRKGRMQEAVVAAMKRSKLFKNPGHYDGMLKFFRSFHENRKGLNTNQLCPNPKTDELFQTSIIDVLLEGGYKGNLPIGTLGRRGNISVGTYDGLDGEMVGDGKHYWINGEGKAIVVPDSFKTPFAVTTHFEADKTIPIREPLTLQQLQKLLDSHLPNKNIFYAFKITGTFEYLKTRSVPKQNEPYPKFSDVLKTQPTFEFRNVKGTMVGFWAPDYVKGINATGYHFHFITEDKKSGGHVLELKTDSIKGIKMEIDYTCGLHINLSKNY
jgi:acetolactate decarboxylase